IPSRPPEGLGRGPHGLGRLRPRRGDGGRAREGARPAPRGRARGGAGRAPSRARPPSPRSEEHTSELQSLTNIVCRLLLEKNTPREIRFDNRSVVSTTAKVVVAQRCRETNRTGASASHTQRAATALLRAAPSRP